MQRVIANAYRAHGGEVCGGYLFILGEGWRGELCRTNWRIAAVVGFRRCWGGLVPLCELRSVLKLISEGESRALITVHATGAVYALIAFVNCVARRRSCGSLAAFSIMRDHSSD